MSKWIPWIKNKMGVSSSLWLRRRSILFENFYCFCGEWCVNVMNERSIKPVIVIEVVLSSPWVITDVAPQFRAVVSYNNAYYEAKAFKQVK